MRSVLVGNRRTQGAKATGPNYFPNLNNLPLIMTPLKAGAATLAVLEEDVSPTAGAPMSSRALESSGVVSDGTSNFPSLPLSVEVNYRHSSKSKDTYARSPYQEGFAKGGRRAFAKKPKREPKTMGLN